MRQRQRGRGKEKKKRRNGEREEEGREGEMEGGIEGRVLYPSSTFLPWSIVIAKCLPLKLGRLPLSARGESEASEPAGGQRYRSSQHLVLL